MSERLEKLKELVGIACANCESCTYLGTDGDGPEYGGSWPICCKEYPKTNLSSFPFKREQECWEPDFWHSKFAECISKESDLEEAFDRFARALREFKCYEQWREAREKTRVQESMGDA